MVVRADGAEKKVLRYTCLFHALQEIARFQEMAGQQFTAFQAFIKENNYDCIVAFHP